MGSFTKFIGRLLFVTLLVSLAYLHITKPQNYVEGFKTNYTHAAEFVHSKLQGLPQFPAASAINWSLWVQIYGAFQALIALFIIVGDGLGGVLLFLTLTVSGAFRFCDVKHICQWKVQKQLEFAQFVLFLGASFALMCSGCNKKPSKITVVQAQEKKQIK